MPNGRLPGGFKGVNEPRLWPSPSLSHVESVSNFYCFITCPIVSEELMPGLEYSISGATTELPRATWMGQCIVLLPITHYSLNSVVTDVLNVRMPRGHETFEGKRASNNSRLPNDGGPRTRMRAVQTTCELFVRFANWQTIISLPHSPMCG